MYLKLPRDMDDARHIGRILDRYKEKYYVEVVASVFLTYILYPLSILETGDLFP